MTVNNVLTHKICSREEEKKNLLKRKMDLKSDACMLVLSIILIEALFFDSLFIVFCC